MIQWRDSTTFGRKSISSDLSHCLNEDPEDLSLTKRDGIILGRSENMPLT